MSLHVAYTGTNPFLAKILEDFSNSNFSDILKSENVTCQETLVCKHARRYEGMKDVRWILCLATSTGIMIYKFGHTSHHTVGCNSTRICIEILTKYNKIKVNFNSYNLSIILATTT